MSTFLIIILILLGLLAVIAGASAMHSIVRPPSSNAIISEYPTEQRKYMEGVRLKTLQVLQAQASMIRGNQHDSSLYEV
ncbi:hypothetical protein N7509_000328 [Penicillium cosmopolitanum]|uniref:Uncharacterized protein n=1 Tax=Penicillium cosmopolitanum TaxID=1131564 RepID=A0A9X0BDY9_9EURO|nr:uncharacterized protein N7509_000328 [Penicillium cosmopolitanum]KAJ5413701.1 hypothetical protein N7509_000328 [Penicillium cosmopolitanum]